VDTGSLESGDLRAAAWRFLKTEAFYLLVLLAVIVLGGWQVHGALRSDGSTRRRLDPIDQKVFQQRITQEDATAARRNPETRSYRILSQTARLTLLYGGAMVASVLVVFFFMRGRLLPPKEGLRPAWGLWDILKVGALFALVSELLWRVCTDTNAPPLLGRGDWIAAGFARLFLIGLILLVVLEERRGAAAQLGLRGPFWSGLATGLTAWLALQPVFGMLEATQLFLLPRVEMQETLVALLLTRDPWTVALIALVAVVLAPVAEELLFRGFLQPAAERWFGTGPAILLSAVFFAVAHPQFSVMAPMFILGLTLAWLFARTRSLVAPIVLHAANNAQVILFYLAIRYPGPTP